MGNGRRARLEPGPVRWILALPLLVCVTSGWLSLDTSLSFQVKLIVRAVQTGGRLKTLRVHSTKRGRAADVAQVWGGG